VPTNAPFFCGESCCDCPLPFLSNSSCGVPTLPNPFHGSFSPTQIFLSLRVRNRKAFTNALNMLDGVGVPSSRKLLFFSEVFFGALSPSFREAASPPFSQLGEEEITDCQSPPPWISIEAVTSALEKLSFSPQNFPFYHCSLRARFSFCASPFLSPILHPSILMDSSRLVGCQSISLG